MKLDKIKDLIYELDEIDADMEDLEIYASMTIENNLKVNVDFMFFGAYEEPVQEPAPLFNGFFYMSSTSPAGISNKDQWSMVKTIDQSIMLRMFGLMMEDMTKKRLSVINKLKRLGVDERTTNTVKKN